MIYVLDSALKHGLDEDNVVHAWVNAFEHIRCRKDKQPPHYMALGLSKNGAIVELVAFSDGLNWYIFHAQTPVTAGLKHEFQKNGGLL